MTVDDDNTLTSKGPGHRLKGLFRSTASSPKKDDRKKAAQKSKEEPVMEKTSSPEAAPPKEVQEEPEVTPVPAEPEVEAVTMDKSAIYVDDNDGDKGGPCAACDGCTIL